MANSPTKHVSEEATNMFDGVIGAFARDRSVTQAKMFGSVVLKVKNKVFAMLVKGKLVVKLPKERVAALVAARDREYFDPEHGKVSKEWVAVKAGDQTAWVKLAKEAKDFVAS